eukprot:scaffold95399_cov31-Tisochrysis_lutea.AAC.8
MEVSDTARARARAWMEGIEKEAITPGAGGVPHKLARFEAAHATGAGAPIASGGSSSLLFQSAGGGKIEMSAAARARGRAWMDGLEMEDGSRDLPGGKKLAGFETAHAAVTGAAVACGASGLAPPPIRPINKPAGPGGFKRPRPKGAGLCSDAASGAPAQLRVCLGPDLVRPSVSASELATPVITTDSPSAARELAHIRPATPLLRSNQRSPLMVANGQRGAFKAPRKMQHYELQSTPQPNAVYCKGTVASCASSTRRHVARTPTTTHSDVRVRCKCATVQPLRARACPSCCPSCGGCLEDPRSIQVMHCIGCRNGSVGPLPSNSINVANIPARSEVRFCVAVEAVADK